MQIFNQYFKKNRYNSAFLLIALSVMLTLLRFFIVNLVDISVLRNEEVSIYLHAAEKSCVEFFMMPDSNYINLINKFCAVLTLKVLKAFDNYAQVQNILNWFFAALCSSLFLTKQFEILIRSWKIRLALCFYVYLLPVLDFYMVFSQGYYLVFVLLFYLLVLSDIRRLTSGEIVFICLSAPFAVFSKPVFFVFGFAFLGLFFLHLYRCVCCHRPLKVHLWILTYILALYVFQVWFTTNHSSYMREFAHHFDKSNIIGLLFFLAGKVVIFLGYGLICPLAHVLPRNIANMSCFFAGLIVAGTIVLNCIILIKNRLWVLLTVLMLLITSCLITLYGAISVNFLYERFFVQDIFAFQWSQRIIFPVILLALFSCIFSVQRLHECSEKIIIAVLWLLCALSYGISSWSCWSTGYMPSFTWKQTRPLLEERYPFIPHAYGIEFYYMRGLQFVSKDVAFKSVGNNSLAVLDALPEKKILYVMLKQIPDSNAFSLTSSDALIVNVDGVEYKARLINPGLNAEYLFKFDEFVPSDAFKQIHITRPLALTGRSVSGYFIGL
ncbi:hypothetical protein JMF94_14535 [Desulfovibrio sp. UIB00]|nr:hypothetical protein [Desulfovibrio sp. UIB00]